MPRSVRHSSFKKANYSNHFSSSGFTLIEVVAVLIVLAVLTAVAVSRFSTSSISLDAQAAKFRTHLRFAQIMAMSTDAVWSITCTSNSYSLSKAGFGAVTIPGESGSTAMLGDGISFSSSGTVGFGIKGEPYTDSTGATPQTSLRKFTLSRSGESLDITITPYTGFIP